MSFGLGTIAWLVAYAGTGLSGLRVLAGALLAAGQSARSRSPILALDVVPSVTKGAVVMNIHRARRIPRVSLSHDVLLLLVRPPIIISGRSVQQRRDLLDGPDVIGHRQPPLRVSRAPGASYAHKGTRPRRDKGELPLAALIEQLQRHQSIPAGDEERLRRVLRVVHDPMWRDSLVLMARAARIVDE